MKESDVLRLFLARRDNYAVTRMEFLKGRLYQIEMGKQQYTGVIITTSFEYYERRYHILKDPPTLVICFIHNTVLPVACLSLQKGNFARPYELPEQITDIDHQRASKTGSRVLLGMYLSGMRHAQELISELPSTTRRRYLQRASDLGKRRRGRPVGARKLPVEERR